MRFARLGFPGEEIPTVRHGDDFYDLTPLTPDIDGAFLETLDPVAIEAAISGRLLPRVLSADRLRVGAPIARPSAIYCIGMNYAAHARESGAKPPNDLVMFMKAPNTIAGPFDEIALPPNSTRLDWEVELGIVIGRRASYLPSAEAALEHIAGFVLANDLSEREWQLERSGGQWSKGKNFPGFTPLGPWLVTPEEVEHAELRVRSWVNDEPRQDSTTADLIFSVEQVIYRLSQFLQLEPGDLVLTGTPEGVALSGRFPYLQPGDEVEFDAGVLGHSRQRVGGRAE